MSRKHPLSYPAPTPQKRHFAPLRGVTITQERTFLFNVLFGHSLMRGPFNKLSGHGVVPILLGAALVADGHLHLVVRCGAVLACVVWFSLSVGVWVSETEYKRQWKAIAFCFASGGIGMVAMGIMYWLLFSMLEDQQNDTAQNLQASVDLPSSDPYLSVFRVVNAGKTGLVRHKFYCSINESLVGNDIHFSHVAVGYDSGLSEVPIHPGGDSEPKFCLSALPTRQPLKCVDLSLFYHYWLESQPGIEKSKEFRLMGILYPDNTFHWTSWTLDAPAGC